ncbi:MAG: TlpA family protein disulfide reductase, partial [Acidobacteria bacterium]|nr:TlpA family protein disulfide reductase [Acidobacteriota bacterium]
MTTMRSTAHRRAARLAVAAALALLWAGAARAAEFKTAPPLSAPGLDGKPIQVKYADARVTLVNFWATWCLPCREEMPAIN